MTQKTVKNRAERNRQLKGWLESEMPGVFKIVLQKAQDPHDDDQMEAAKLLINKLLPQNKYNMINMSIETNDPKLIHETLVHRTASGEINVDEAQKMSQMLTHQQKINDSEAIKALQEQMQKVQDAINANESGANKKLSGPDRAEDSET